MTGASTAQFIRYLASKKSVDDRALNVHVLQSFRRALRNWTGLPPLRLLEVGAGIGTMIERLLDWNVLPEAVITIVDEQEDLLLEAHRRLKHFAERHGFVAHEGTSSLELRGDRPMRIEFVAHEAVDFAQSRRDGPLWDVLLAHAFLDLVDLPTALGALTAVLADSALLYLTVNFDGTTLFLPEIDRSLDQAIEALYHRTMDERRRDGRPCGGSHTGRRLFQALPESGAEILDVGASDWLVFAPSSGYPGDERFFLHWILDSHESALRGSEELDRARLADWIAERRRQIERGELVYMTHQLDFLARMAHRPSQAVS